jgi:hypothetical protein
MPPLLKRWAPVSGLTPGLKENGHTGKSGYVTGSTISKLQWGKASPHWSQELVEPIMHHFLGFTGRGKTSLLLVLSDRLILIFDEKFLP